MTDFDRLNSVLALRDGIRQHETSIFVIPSVPLVILNGHIECHSERQRRISTPLERFTSPKPQTLINTRRGEGGVERLGGPSWTPAGMGGGTVVYRLSYIFKQPTLQVLSKHLLSVQDIL